MKLYMQPYLLHLKDRGIGFVQSSAKVGSRELNQITFSTQSNRKVDLFFNKSGLLQRSHITPEKLDGISIIERTFHYSKYKKSNCTSKTIQTRHFDGKTLVLDSISKFLYSHNNKSLEASKSSYNYFTHELIPSKICCRRDSKQIFQ